MKNFVLFSFFCLFTFTAWSQTTDGLTAYYSFDEADPSAVNDQSGNGSNGVITGTPSYACGVSGDALQLNGLDTKVLFLGTVNNVFNKKDFSLSLYIKPTLASGVRHVINKKDGCSNDNIFDVSFLAGSNLLNVDLIENTSKSASVNAPLDFGSCWQHVVVVRAGNRTKLYLNGELRKESKAVSRVDILNNTVLSIGAGLCDQANEQAFIGLIDEIRVYDRALEKDDVQSLYLAPDKLITNDTTIFLGNPVDIFASNTCATTFDWSPATNVDDPSALEPTISPTETTTYTLRLDDNICTSFDTIRISVINPDDLNCEEVYLPKAFTPNGDGLNDLYGISNPYAIQNDLISFEIYDRWGGRVFFTDNPFEGWNGLFKGEPMNPGVLLYRVRYSCEGEEKASVGSLSIVR